MRFFSKACTVNFRAFALIQLLTTQLLTTQLLTTQLLTTQLLNYSLLNMYFDAQFLQLFVADGRGRINHHVASCVVFRESDVVAY